MECNHTNLLHLKTKFEIKYDYPIFSFKHLTSNKKFNFEGIKHEEKDGFKKLLLDKIQEIESNYTTRTLFSLRKPNYFESIPAERLNFNIDTIKISKDTKVYVFRVTSDYRMICVFSDIAPIFHIVGFDFRFNAYNHG